MVGPSRCTRNARRRGTLITCAALLGMLGLAACERGAPPATTTPAASAARPVAKAAPAPSPVRISMDALHRAGGVPPGWMLTPPPGDPGAGREQFADLGCGSCHAVQGESFAGGQRSPGPDLSGMGSHHPPAYFLESILNPNAVLVDDPGYVGADGLSLMPAYPYLTLTQLTDLVAYLSSLKMAGMQHAMGSAPKATPSELPAAPEQPGKRFYVQVYDVNPGQLRPFEEWFKKEGAPELLAYPGLTSVETFVDLSRSGPAFTTIFAFNSEDAIWRFMQDPKTEDLGARFDAFIGPHDHTVLQSLPMYKVSSLSAP
jgi:mono/diheme cytochrome c family protein